MESRLSSMASRQSQVMGTKQRIRNAANELPAPARLPSPGLIKDAMSETSSSRTSFPRRLIRTPSGNLKHAKMNPAATAEAAALAVDVDGAAGPVNTRGPSEPSAGRVNVLANQSSSPRPQDASAACARGHRRATAAEVMKSRRASNILSAPPPDECLSDDARAHGAAGEDDEVAGLVSAKDHWRQAVGDVHETGHASLHVYHTASAAAQRMMEIKERRASSVALPGRDNQRLETIDGVANEEKNEEPRTLIRI